EGPIAGVNIGRIDGEFVINPTVEDREKSDLDLTVAGTKDAISMVEASGNEIPEDSMLEAILLPREEIKRLDAFQEEIVQAAGKEKMEVSLFNLDEELSAELNKTAKDRLVTAIQTHEKLQREESIEAVKKDVVATYEANDADEDTIKKVKDILDQIV